MCEEELRSFLPEDASICIQGGRWENGYYSASVSVHKQDFVSFYVSNNSPFGNHVRRVEWSGSEEIAVKILGCLKKHASQLQLEFGGTMVISKDVDKAIQTYTEDFQRRLRKMRDGCKSDSDFLVDVECVYGNMITDYFS
jgi:hypothetical protein